MVQMMKVAILLTFTCLCFYSWVFVDSAQTSFPILSVLEHPVAELYF